MKKDNFDLRSYLIENKMTENSRGDVRHHLGETILDTRILSEMQIPADPDQDDPNFEDSADQLDDMWDSQTDAGLDECGDFGGDMPIDEAMDQRSFITLCREKGYEVDDPRRAILWATMRDQFSDPDKSVLDAKLGVNDANVDQWLSRQDELNTEPDVFEEVDPNYDPMEHPEDWPKDYIQKLNRNNNRTAKRDTEKIVKNNPSAARDFIDEAGYTDDDDDEWTDPDAIGDDDNGASLLDLVRGDKKAANARKAATKDSADDFDPTAGEPESFGDEPAVDPEDAEPSAGESDPNAEAQPGLSAQIKYNPNTVEMMMDNQELDQYLSGFRRPQVAVNVLNRAIRTAQDEVNDSIGLNHLYIVLENGFYVTSRTERGQVIAKVNADQEWRKKNFGED